MGPRSEVVDAPSGRPGAPKAPDAGGASNIQLRPPWIDGSQGLRIVIVSNYYSAAMGYSENCLPAALARLGHDVQVVTSTLKPYGLSSFYADVYEPFLGPPVVEPEIFEDKGIRVTRLPYFRFRDRIGLKGLTGLLRSINPDVVEVFDYPSLTALQATWAGRRSGFELFTASHVPVSVFPPAQSAKLGFPTWAKLRLLTWLPGRIVSMASHVTYAPTEDAAYVAVRFFGVQKNKIRHMSLGVDGLVFRPVEAEADRQERQRVRDELGVDPNEILCIYTGRFTDAKDPLVLSRAVETLRRSGYRLAALFIGEGQQANEIAARDGSRILPFVDYRRLGPYYRAADIGVWPREESTSMLDAAACGIPIVVSDRIRLRHTIEGNGLTYSAGDAEDLARALLDLGDEEYRGRLGAVGSERMSSEFSWDEIARRRSRDYSEALALR